MRTRPTEEDVSAESKILVPWSEVFGSDPFVILCCRFPQGEQFMVVPAEGGNRTIVEAMGLTAGAFVTETDVRHGLTRMGLSQSDATARIQLAREWATTVGRPAGPR
jgi:hypothetical protein